MTNSLHYPRRGSALLATVIIIMLLAVVIGSTIPLSVENYRTAVRQTENRSAFNLAEVGLEQAVHDLRMGSKVEDLETMGWTLSNDSAFLTRTITQDDFPTVIREGLNPFQIRLVMQNPVGSETISVVSEALIQSGPALRGGSARRIAELLVKVELLSEGGGRSPFEGLISTGFGVDENSNALLLNNSTAFRSYDSNSPIDGMYNGPILGENDGEKIAVGTMNGKAELRSSQIYGTVVSGRDVDSPLDDRYFNSDPGFKATNGAVGRYENDFPVVPPPVPPTGLPEVPFPTDGRAYIGDPSASTPTVYRASNNFSLNSDFEIRGPVILIIENGVNFNGGSSLTIAPGADVQIFTAGKSFQPNHAPIHIHGKLTLVTKLPNGTGGDVTIHEVDMASGAEFEAHVGGGGHFRGNLNQGNRPSNLRIYGSHQDISFNGNVGDTTKEGQFSGIIYAPHARVLNDGNSLIKGAIVAREFHLNQDPLTFWFDESLRNLGGGGDPLNPSAYAFKGIERYYLPRTVSQEFVLMAGVDQTYNQFLEAAFNP